VRVQVEIDQRDVGCENVDEIEEFGCGRGRSDDLDAWIRLEGGSKRFEERVISICHDNANRIAASEGATAHYLTMPETAAIDCRTVNGLRKA